MATTKKYVSLEKLGLYDEKIKGVISAGDAATLAAAAEAAESLGVNYDAAGSAATAKSEAVAHTNAEIAKVNTAVEAAQAQADKGVADAATADGKAVAAQGAVDELAEYVGTIPESATATDVIGYVQEKTAGIATEGAMTELGNRVATIEGDYLKAADKTELEGKIAAVQTAVDTEKGRAEGIEAGLRTDVDAIKGDYLKAVDKTELQGNIDTVSAAVERLTNGVSADEVDGVNDLIKYVKDHGTEVTGMQEDISDNADAIAGVAGRMDTAEGKITAVEGAVATKVEQSVLDEAIEALEGADSGLDARLQAVESKFGNGEGNVEAQIEAAKTAAIEAAAADATTKANTAETNAKSHADGLNTAMNTRVEALEAIDHSHANQAELDLIATGDKAKWDTASAKAHEHANSAELDKIADGDVAKWNAAEGNAKTFAQGLNDAMGTRMVTVETWQTNFVECSEEDINALFTTNA